MLTANDLVEYYKMQDKKPVLELLLEPKNVFEKNTAFVTPFLFLYQLTGLNLKLSVVILELLESQLGIEKGDRIEH